MSIYAGPEIVNDKLQICLDWSNKKCYTGTGTTFTNLINSSRNNGYLKNSVTYSTDNGGILTTSGNNGSGLQNAVGDRIDIETSTANVDRFDKTDSFSIFYMNYYIAGAGKILSTGSSGAGTGDSDNCIWQMWMDSSKFYWWDTNGGQTNNIICNCARTANKWQYVGFTYSYNESGNNVVRTYINGSLVTSASIATATHSAIGRSGQTNLQWTLGGGYTGSCFTTNSQNKFGHFVLYNKKLSDEEISQNFNALRGRFGI